MEKTTTEETYRERLAKKIINKLASLGALNNRLGEEEYKDMAKQISTILAESEGDD